MTTEKPTETLPEYDDTQIIERPDGFYWVDQETSAERGPFKTLQHALEDMNYKDESAYEPNETLEEAEAEIGIADWIDPETGEPAEESVPRLEDH